MPGTGTWIVIGCAIAIVFFAYETQTPANLQTSDMLIVGMGVVLGALLVTLMG